MTRQIKELEDAIAVLEDEVKPSTKVRNEWSEKYLKEPSNVFVQNQLTATKNLLAAVHNRLAGKEADLRGLKSAKSAAGAWCGTR